jgi:pyridoxal phosphate enzyme (YggS family)
MMTESEIIERLAGINERISGAARRCSRERDSIRLVLASKTQPADAIRAAYRAGAREFGENYVQEAIGKQDELADLTGIRWHLIGHLQTNKARQASARFEMIHSVASVRLAQALHRARPQPPVRVLLEINVGAEASKNGIAPEEAEPLLAQVRDTVEVAGLMTIPPPGSTPEHSRPYFSRLRELRDRLAAHAGLTLSELSMGMTDDFEVAIEEGATIVRVGRAVFGERKR